MSKNNRSAPTINAGSMADIAFLLLIFFLVTTTIAEDRGIRVKLPPWTQDVPIVDIAQKNSFMVKINANNELLVRNQAMPIALLKDKTIEFILNPNKRPDLAENPRKAVVSLQNDRGTSYSAYIEVYDQLKAAYNEIWEQEAQQRFARNYELLSFDEKKTIRKKYPFILSESEPSNFY